MQNTQIDIEYSCAKMKELSSFGVSIKTFTIRSSTNSKNVLIDNPWTCSPVLLKKIKFNSIVLYYCYRLAHSLLLPTSFARNSKNIYQSILIKSCKKKKKCQRHPEDLLKIIILQKRSLAFKTE